MLRRLTELPGLESQPDLSPDGRQLVYSSAASGNLDVFLMRTDGGRAINITASSYADDEQAAFSPDGERLVFRSSRDGGGLFLMGATGESVRRLTDGGFDPAWSPDGKRIAYWANTSGQRDLWTVGVEGGEPAAVTADLATDWSPEWSPDGRWLYFASDRRAPPVSPDAGRRSHAPTSAYAAPPIPALVQTLPGRRVDCLRDDRHARGSRPAACRRIGAAPADR